jgi:hypothetical protein
VASLRSDRWLIHAFANPVGSGGIGGHKHNDMLSFTASCDGVPVIIDPGTGAYTADPSARNRFRRTSAHATVEIDGAEQNRFVARQLFCLWQDASPEIVEFADTGDVVRIVMRHDGYTRLHQPVVHSRALTLDRTTETLRIKDRLEGDGVHRVSVAFPLADIVVDRSDDVSAGLVLPDGGRLILELSSTEPLRLHAELGWRSRAYGTREGHRRLVFRGSVNMPCEWETTIRVAPCGPNASDDARGCKTTNELMAALSVAPVTEVAHA